jgi:hypothetical protein
MFWRISPGYLVLLVLLSSICLFQYFGLLDTKQDIDPSLHEMACRLHDAGLRFRAVSPRQDGLLTKAVYLTQTDLDDRIIRSLVVDPSRLEKWHGTVKVFFENDPQFHLCTGDDWNNCSCRYGRFVMFGDRELIEEIVRKLESGNPETPRLRPPARTIARAE